MNYGHLVFQITPLSYTEKNVYKIDTEYLQFYYKLLVDLAIKRTIQKSFNSLVWNVLLLQSGCIYIEKCIK